MIPYALNPNLQLKARRCQNCNRWFANEAEHLWCCGMCERERGDKLRSDLDKAKRANAALRGLLGRRP